MTRSVFCVAALLLPAASMVSSCEVSAPERLERRGQALEVNLSPLDPIHPSDASPGDRFGVVVATTGDWLVAMRHVVLDDSVQVLASRSTSTGWTEPSRLVPTNVGTTRWLSSALATHTGSIDEAFVGTGQTEGSVLVFDLESGTQTQRIDSPSAGRQRFGSAIAARNHWMAVGDYLDGPLGDEPGAVHLYNRGGGGWAFSQSLTGVASSRFGRALALSDKYLAVGAPEENEPSTKTAGAVHVFELENGSWSFRQTLYAPTPESDARFGHAVALSDDALFVVCRFDSAFAHQAGAVYVYERAGSNWSFAHRLGAAVPKARGGFGESIAFDGELVSIGEHADPSQVGGDQRGAVSTYHFQDGVWELLQRFVPGPELTSATTQFGHAIALGGERLVIGAPDLQTSSEHSGMVASWSIIHTETSGACAEGIECATGNCVDGVCCDAPCEGTCVACSAAKKGHGEDGICEAILEGLDPDDECPADASAANACAPESACTGNASCGCVVPGTLQCSSADERVDESGNRVSCAPFRCRANTCLTTCASSADCSDGARCSSDRRCVVPQAGSPGESGCGVVRRPSSAPAWIPAVLAGLWFIRRWRRHSRSTAG